MSPISAESCFSSRIAHSHQVPDRRCPPSGASKARVAISPLYDGVVDRRCGCYAGSVTRDSACVALGFEDDVRLTSASKPRHNLSSDMSSSRAAKPLFRKRRVRQSWNTFFRRVRRWRRARWTRRKLAAAPSAVRIALVVATILAAFFLANLVYQVVRKPTELLFFVGRALDKVPAETWRQYGPLFREYATGTITPELLAALAHVESSGNPVARTYWRWRLTLNPFAVYKPASSAVGLYQTTDPAYAEAARYCIRRHAVVDAGCGFNSLYIRVVPSQAVELAAVYLDRKVAAVLASAPDAKASPRQSQDLAALIHLCGAGRAWVFVRRGFQVMAGERCGDHPVATYLAKVNVMKRQFLRLAANGEN